MKKRKRVIILVCILLLAGSMSTVMAQEIKDETEKKVELIVLLDTSGTMNEERKNREIEWAQQICAAGAYIDINISFVCFNDEINMQEYDSKVISNTDPQTCLNALSGISPTGGTTDLYGAMEWAVNTMEQNDADIKCIVMLSDGRLDLVGREDNGTPYELEDYEIEKLNEFENLVLDFNKSENQTIVLVEFDGLSEEYDNKLTIKGEEKNLFQSLKNEGIIYFYWKDQASEAIYKIFELINYPLTSGEEGESANNKIDFEVGDNCYRVIVNIRNKNTGLSQNNADSIKLTQMNKDGNIPIDKVLFANRFAFLYINELKEGNYTITLPNGNWNYSIMYQNKAILDGVELIVMQDGSEATINTDYDTNWPVYTVNQDEFSLEIELKYMVSPAEDEPIIAKCCLQSYGEPRKEVFQDTSIESAEFKSVSVKAGDSRNTNMVELTKQEPGTYFCKVKIDSGGNSYYSNPVWIIVEDKEAETEVVNNEARTIKVGEQINLDELIADQNIEGDIEFYLEYAESGNSIQFDEGNSVEYDEFKVENRSLAFLEGGEYTLCFKTDNKTVYQSYQVESRNVCELLSDWWMSIVLFFENKMGL